MSGAPLQIEIPDSVEHRTVRRIDRRGADEAIERFVDAACAVMPRSEIVERHDTLRTILHLAAGQPSERLTRSVAVRGRCRLEQPVHIILQITGDQLLRLDILHRAKSRSSKTTRRPMVPVSAPIESVRMSRSDDSLATRNVSPAPRRTISARRDRLKS